MVLDSGETIIHMDYKVIKILLGGDQLTVARAHGAKGMRVNHETAKSCLKGIIPVIEDWHTRLTLMKVCGLREPPYIIVYIRLRR